MSTLVLFLLHFAVVRNLQETHPSKYFLIADRKTNNI